MEAYIIQQLGADALRPIWRQHDAITRLANESPREQGIPSAPSASPSKEEKEQEWWERYYGRGFER